jgi:hypothetical protein
MSETDFRTEDARAEAEQSATADEQVTGRDAGAVDEDALRVADGLTVSEDVKQSYQEATERGANVQGEGSVP